MNCLLMLITISISAWTSSPVTNDYSWQDIWLAIIFFFEASKNEKSEVLAWEIDAEEHFFAVTFRRPYRGFFTGCHHVNLHLHPIFECEDHGEATSLANPRK